MVIASVWTSGHLLQYQGKGIITDIINQYHVGMHSVLLPNLK